MSKTIKSAEFQQLVRKYVTHVKTESEKVTLMQSVCCIVKLLIWSWGLSKFKVQN